MHAIVYDRKSSTSRSFKLDQAKPALSSKKDTKEVLVRVKAAAINPVDYKLPVLFFNKKVVGMDLAGVVEASSSPDFAPGDEVFGSTSGALAEFALCDATKIAHKPAALSWQQAAAMPTAYLTGYQFLKAGGLKAGEKVLVIGASGGCGSAAVQLARAMGASEIVGVCSGKNEDFVKGLGATSVVDYTKSKLSDSVKPKSFDVVLDAATNSGGGEDYFSQAEAASKDGRRVLALNGGPMRWFKSITGLQSALNSKTSMIFTKHSREDLNSIVSLMGLGAAGSASAAASAAAAGADAGAKEPAFLPIIDTVLPFTEAGMREGFERLQSRRTRGKIVFDMDQH